MNTAENLHDRFHHEVDIESEPLGDYLRERPALVLSMLDLAERYAAEERTEH